MYQNERFAAVACAFALLCSSGSARGEFIKNGGFEKGNFEDWTQSGVVSNTGVSGIDGPGIGKPRSGDYYAYFGTDGLGGLSQSFKDPNPGEQLKVTLSLASTGGSDNYFQIGFDGSTLYTANDFNTRGYTQLSFIVTSQDFNSFELSFDNPHGYFSVDDIDIRPADVVATPAPSAAIMVLSSVVFGLGLGLRRRFAVAPAF